MSQTHIMYLLHAVPALIYQINNRSLVSVITVRATNSYSKRWK